MFCKKCNKLKCANEAIAELVCKNASYQNTLKKYEALKGISYFNSICQEIVLVEEMNSFYFVVTIETERDFAGKLTGINFHGYTLNPNLERPKKVATMFTEPKYDLKYNIINYFYIIDFTCEPNKGYGSKVMEQFLRYISRYKSKKVIGEFSYVDEIDQNNKSRRNHFYKKFGFHIKENKIELYLDY